MQDPSTRLFNPRTVTRLCTQVSLTPKQKYRAKEWLALLESGELEKEKQNYFKFGIIVLQDILGYPIEKGLKFEEGNVEFSFRNEINGKGVCIEAKGTATRDLFSEQNRAKPEHSTPIKQTWDYVGKNNFDYGISTNYRYFVLIDRAKGYSTYHLFDFLAIKEGEDRLKEFIAIFSNKTLLEIGFVAKLFAESIVEEREFTKEFYKLYHETRLMLIKAFQVDGGSSKDEAIHFAQLFLNRVIFVFFAEETGKLPKRLFRDQILPILEAAPISEHSRYVFDTMTTLFEGLDRGATTPVSVFGFNGGLFAERIPPSVHFKDFAPSRFFDDVFQFSTFTRESSLDDTSQRALQKYHNRINPIVKNLLILSSFDFNTELNVNILGHIFEQSVSDLEELKGEGEVARRKKEGIYYTPQFVTDFICRKTILSYFSQKGARTVGDLIEEYEKDIDVLQRKFRDVKILDPACGSGAFLLRAVDILLEIERGIREVKESKGKYIAWGSRGSTKNNQFVLTKWNEEEEARHIIENNIFGVDINVESVEITKLSLFLKLASNNRKLIDLSKNIRVGNSLIDDPDVAGDKAFDWKAEFGEVFAEGGFDVIVGNPPYVRVQELRYKDIDYFKSHYPEVAHKRVDISVVFFGLANRVMSKIGRVGFICSSQFLTAEYGRRLRGFLLSKRIECFVDFDSLRVFEDAITYPVVIIFSNGKPSRFDYVRVTKLTDGVTRDLVKTIDEGDSESLSEVTVNPADLGEEVWNLSMVSGSGLTEKIRGYPECVKLGSFANPSTGVTTGLDEVLIADEKKLEELKLERNAFIRVLRGRNIEPWTVQGPFDYAFYPYKLENGETKLMSEEDLRNSYPNTYRYLVSHKSDLLGRKDSRKTVAEDKEWYGLIRKGRLGYFQSQKIVTPALTKHNSFALDRESSAYVTGGAGVFAMIQDGSLDDYYLLAVLNSKLVEYFLHSIATKKQGGYFSYLGTFLAEIPVFKPDKQTQSRIGGIAKKLEVVITEIEARKKKFGSRLAESFGRLQMGQRIADPQDLEFAQFAAELRRKTGKGLALKAADEWEDYFDEYKRDIVELNREKERLIGNIDDAVFDIYRLTASEKRSITEAVAA